MPRQSRIDAPGALHHVIFRGIERKAIFKDDADVMNSSNGSHRYKSILCQGETYLLELTRYIHLNPLRVGIVKHLGALDTYLFTGHSVIMGNQQADWQNDTKILVMFAKTKKTARRKYRQFVEKGIDAGRRPELVGGGLIRSVGGWKIAKTLLKGQDRVKGDERILGDSDFVQSVFRL